VALGWHEEGIRTIEQAKQQSSQYTQQYYSVLKAFGVTGRSPIEQEIRMIDHWMKDYGFDTELICEACSRTIQQINKVSFAYADTILTNWKNLNVRTRKDIEAADAVHESRRQSQKAAQEKPKTANTRATQSRFNNFKQRQYDYRKLEQQLLSAGKKE
jgi:DnaD/phage-associated family protein